MAVNITVPSFGESVSEGTIAQWLKKPGDAVKQDEIILEIESEKATQGIPAPVAGILKIDKKEGDRVEVGSIIGTIDEAAVPAKPTAEPVAATPPKEVKPVKAAEPAKPVARKEPEPAAQAEAPSPASN